MKEWTFVEAEQNFEQVFEAALTGEVQVIRRDNQRVVAIPYEHYQELVEAQKRTQRIHKAENSITAQDIIDAVRERRERDVTNPSPENEEE